MRSVAILGATGSVGTQALAVIADHPGLRAAALAAHSDADGLVAAARRHRVGLIALADEAAADRARGLFDGRVLAGEAGVLELVRAAEADVVLNAVVGAAGLRATVAAVEAGADVALANKESLVAGGELVTELVRRAGRRLIPVDSEHSALAQCLSCGSPDAVTGVVLTASGGPFRGRSRAELAGVTRDEALAHPTWSMGAKITVDSATLMNKGLELIEAHHLFDIAFDSIEVVVHPQSIVHGMARFRDGALIAHVGHPDMRVPISWALTFPDRAATRAPVLDLAEPLSLTFEPPDEEAFPALPLAREAGVQGGTAPAVLNAANEVAVAAFLGGAIGFLDIPAVVASVLDRVSAAPLDSLEAVLDADRRARREATALLEARV